VPKSAVKAGTDYIHFGNDGKIYITRNMVRAAGRHCNHASA
jgi:hypothetical protein